MLEKIIVIDKIEILELGQIQVQESTKIIENGIEIAKTFWRKAFCPGDELSGRGSDERVIKIASVIWTKDVIKKYKDTIKESMK